MESLETVSDVGSTDSMTYARDDNRNVTATEPWNYGITTFPQDQMLDRLKWSRQFLKSPLSPTEDIVVAVYLSLVGIVGLILNGFVLAVSYHKRRIFKPAEWFITAISASDLLLLTSFPLPIAASISHGWVSGKNGCVAYAFFGYFTVLCCINMLAVTSVVRAVKTSFPSIGNRFGKKCSISLIIGVYVYALCWASMPFAGYGKFGPEPSNVVCSLDWTNDAKKHIVYLSMLFVMSFFVPLIIMVMSYCAILLTQRRTIRLQLGNNAKLRFKRLTKLTLAMSVGFLIAWLPYAIFAMWMTYGDPAAIPARFTAVPSLFAKTSALYNPFVYFFTSKRFRNASKDLLKKLCIRSNKVNPSTSARNPTLDATAGSAVNEAIINGSQRMQQGRKPSDISVQATVVNGKEDLELNIITSSSKFSQYASSKLEPRSPTIVS